MAEQEPTRTLTLEEPKSENQSRRDEPGSGGRGQVINLPCRITLFPGDFNNILSSGMNLCSPVPGFREKVEDQRKTIRIHHRGSTLSQAVFQKLVGE